MREVGRGDPSKCRVSLPQSSRLFHRSSFRRGRLFFAGRSRLSTRSWRAAESATTSVGPNRARDALDEGHAGCTRGEKKRVASTTARSSRVYDRSRGGGFDTPFLPRVCSRSGEKPREDETYRSCCQTPTHEYVVPRSIPMAGPSTLAMVSLPCEVRGSCVDERALAREKVCSDARGSRFFWSRTENAWKIAGSRNEAWTGSLFPYGKPVTKKTNDANSAIDSPREPSLPFANLPSPRNRDRRFRK